MSDLRQKLIELLEPELARMGYELVELEARAHGQNGLLRIYIDHADGIGLEQCAEVSRRVGALLDVEDPMPGAYELEVSSPGFDRPLRTEAHFAQVVGQVVKIKTVRPLDGRRRFKGLLRSVDAGQLQVEVDGAVTGVPLELVEKANLVPEV